MKIKNLDIDYESLFSYMVIREEWKDKVRKTAISILANKETYEEVAQEVNEKMPWYFVGIIHCMERSLDFSTHLHNGDSLLQRTVNVPAGRPVTEPKNGKKYTWKESAIDALTYMGFDKKGDWSLQYLLYRFEKYNGFGYELYHDMLSPYLWSGTEYYVKGKYDKDGHFDAELVSKQVGAAPLLLYLTDNTKHPL